MRLVHSPNPEKKWRAEFDDGTHTDFGSAGMDDYTKTGDKERRALYLIRHSKNENWRDYKSAGALSRFILWGDSTSIATNLTAYKRRFNL